MPRVASDAAAHIGRRIAHYRQELALTQGEVAVRSGIDSSNVRAYESGRGMPNIASLVRLASALGIEPGDLLTGLTPELFAPSSPDRRRRAQ